MKKYVIILDKSWLAQNIYRAILAGHMNADCAMHVEDVDVLASSQMPDALVVGENVYVKEKWDLLETRNPDLKRVQKIFITRGDNAPKGFLVVKRPIKPEDLLYKLCDNKKIVETGKKDVILQTMGRGRNRRVFGRNPLNTRVYFHDEFGEPLIYLTAKDISLGGMFIECGIPLGIGSLAFLSFEIEKKRISVTGQIIRISDSGIGIRFMGLSKEAEEAISKGHL